MTDKNKVEILKKVQEYRDKRWIPDYQSLKKDGFNEDILKTMVGEKLLGWSGTNFYITKEGDSVLRENLMIGTISEQQEKTKTLAETLTNQYLIMQKSLEQTMNATKCMQNMADSIKTFSFPIKDIKLAIPFLDVIKKNSEALSGIAKIQDWTFKLGGLAEFSNMSKMAQVIKDIPIMKMPVQNITPTIFNNSRKELVSLVGNLEADRDPVYNVEAYRVLFNLEISLRKLINERIILKFPKELDQKLPSNMLDDWKRKKSEEETNAYVDSEGYKLIEFSDFTDLKKIFEKGKNDKLFCDLVSEENFKTIVSKLHELDPIRKKIAHSRILTKREFEKIKMYYDDIIKLFSI